MWLSGETIVDVTLIIWLWASLTRWPGKGTCTDGFSGIESVDGFVLSSAAADQGAMQQCHLAMRKNEESMNSALFR